MCLETSTTLCSVALCDTEGVVAVRESDESKSHAARLTLFIDDLLKEAGINADKLDAVAVSKGPGSYTGLRIGVSVAKGIAYAASIPLIATDTTLSMFHGITGKIRQRFNTDGNTLFVPMLDARRMEVYYSIFNGSGEKVKEVAAEIINEDSFRNFPDDTKIIFFGDGAPKCKSVIRQANAFFYDEFRISAASMYEPVIKAFTGKQFEDVAYFEPFYLKDFITTSPVKNRLAANLHHDSEI